MGTTNSSDGTGIAFDVVGDGPPVIVVDGALCYRGSGPSGQLARELEDDFTVFTYDRRGRGESENTAPHAVEREIEDLAALVEVAGGSASLYGISYGAALALAAADSGLPIERLALYEAPFVVDDSRPAVDDAYVRRMGELAGADPSAAVRLFMTSGVGLSPGLVLVMRLLPAWRKLRGVAHTLPYDIATTERYQRGQPLPEGHWPGVTMPTLVLAGSRSPAWMLGGMRSLAALLPDAEFRVLDTRTHMVKPAELAPVLTAFFGA